MNAAGWGRPVAALVLAGGLAGAAAHAAPGAFLQHRVVEGDTLPAIGARYLRAPARWHELQTLNRIADPANLPAGSVVRVPRRWVRGLSVLAVVIVGVALAKLVPGRFGYWLDLGLALFACYLVGCAIGSWLRDGVVARQARARSAHR